MGSSAECVPSLDFIKRLIIHIPKKHLKMFRYYGIYAKHHKQEKNLRKCLSPEKRKLLLQHLDWRNSILLTFGYDPLGCQKCSSSMLVLEVYHKKAALFERYRKVMAEFPLRSFIILFFISVLLYTIFDYLRNFL